jgi:aromatic ring-opening dioxygenase catalytic subunit (LigB family)
METLQPVLFLSHGAGPSYYLDARTMPMFNGLDKDSKAADFLRTLVKTHGLKKPEAILVISAHWEESVCTVNTNSKHSLYYDYYNFPPEMYKLSWPVKGAPEVARKVKRLLEEHGITCNENGDRGLDHGVFVPLKLVYPDADIPGLLYFISC